ncbi:MAG TPA: helix-turn-helix transcriptional regulator [Mycobacteriales bacterium]|nr:helix-turn-helix transcriptional regulator [Mycobacteriales bacterium]
MNADLAGRLRDADPVVLGERIRNQRLACGLTQAGLADGVVTVGYVSRIEAGQRRPDAALLDRFAQVLGTTAEHLVTGVAPVRADEIALTLLNAELALETGCAEEALAALDPVTGKRGIDLPDDVRQRADFLAARALEALGRYDDAILALEQLVERHSSSGPFLPALLALSRCYRESGDLNRAVDVGELGLTALKEAGVDGGDEAIRLAVTVAAAHFERGDTGHAVRIALNAIRRAEEIGSAKAQAAAYWNASAFQSQRGHAPAAILLAERALQLLNGGEDRRNLARLRNQLGIMLLRQDPPDVNAAVDNLVTALAELVATSASVVDIAHCEVALARARLLGNDDGEAIALATRALSATESIAPAVAAEAAAVLGLVASGDGDIARAAGHYRHAVALLTAVGHDRQAAQLWLELGAELDVLGDSDAARDAYRRAAVASGLRMPSALRVSR